MPLTLDATGLHIQTTDEIREELIAAVVEALALTPTDAERLRTSVQNSLGQIVRISAEREAAHQEALVAVYHTLSLGAEGVPLDRVAALFGLTRAPEQFAEVDGIATGAPNSTIDAGTTVTYEDGTSWSVVADVTFDSSGTASMTLRADVAEAVTVNTATPGPTEWAPTGFDSFTLLALRIPGSARELDAALRSRLAVEVYSRGQGPQAAIRAALTKVAGVTSIGIWESRAALAHEIDDDGIPARSVNCVVVGGDDDEVAQAIKRSIAGGIRAYGHPGASQVSREVTLSNGSPVRVEFNRFAEVPVWIRATLTTSTSEEDPDPDLVPLAAAALSASASSLFPIGADVLPWRLEGLLHAANLRGIDNAVVELSRTGSSFDAAKLPISLREVAAFDPSRIRVLTN